MKFLAVIFMFLAVSCATTQQDSEKSSERRIPQGVEYMLDKR